MTLVLVEKRLVESRLQLTVCCQSSNAAPEEVRRPQNEITSFKQDLKSCRQKAQRSYKCYAELSTCCTSEWNKITALESKSDLLIRQQECSLKNRFNVVDYEMGKLTLY